jgi:hypothetical protein
MNFRPTEGVGNAGCQCTRSLACEINKAHERSHHRSTGFARHSRTQWFTAYFVLSPVIGLVCHRRLARLLARLDAGVEASGPHDFAVRRSSALVVSAARVHRIPPRVDDVAQRPSVGQDGGSCRDDLPDGRSEIFLQMGLDSRTADLPVGQISWLVAVS